jgi:hypothetical protein
VELGALIWALQLPQTPGVNYCHKVGMGKPLGLGSVKISATLHLSDRRARYRKLFDDTQWQPIVRCPATQADDFLIAFESFMLSKMGVTASNLGALPRVRTLLTILRWPGPADNETRYLKIKPDNEFRYRPVLPTAFYVVDQRERNLADQSPKDTPKEQTKPKFAGRVAEPKPLSAEEIEKIDEVMTAISEAANRIVDDAESTAVRLTSPEQALRGRRVLGKVTRVDNDRIKVDIGLEEDADLMFKELPVPQPKSREQARQRFVVDQDLEAEIIKVGKIVQLSMK